MRSGPILPCSHGCNCKIFGNKAPAEFTLMIMKCEIWIRDIFSAVCLNHYVYKHRDFLGFNLDSHLQHIDRQSKNCHLFWFLHTYNSNSLFPTCCSQSLQSLGFGPAWPKAFRQLILHQSSLLELEYPPMVPVAVQMDILALAALLELVAPQAASVDRQ